MTTAFVLSGGGSLGAIQVGGLTALADAVNGGWAASGFDPAATHALADVWRGLSRGQVFPTNPMVGLLGALGRRRNLVSDSGLRRLLHRNVRSARVEDSPIPLRVVPTDVLSGRDILLSRGDAVEAILASAAIPGVLPPVRIDGRELIDCGIVNNTPTSPTKSRSPGESTLSNRFRPSAYGAM
jgi:NTE family protein